MSILRITAGSLAQPQCWTTPQNLVNDFADTASIDIGDLTGIIKSDTAPDPNDRDKGWYKTSAGAPIGLFIYYNGAWLMPHQTPANGDERRLWVGSEVDLQTYDGGSGAAVTAASGPFWEVDHDFDGLFPVGAGIIPGGGGASINVGQTSDTNAASGEYKHTITQAELPAINLPLAVKSGQADNLDNDSSEILTNPANVTLGTNPLTLQVPLGGSGTPFVNAPPFRGVFIIKRTARQYYVG